MTQAYPTLSSPDIARFWSKVAIGRPDECWPWRAGAFDSGYGAFSIGRRLLRAHKVAFELSNGPLPDGMRACHTCDNRPCCNPAHLWSGSDADNVADRDRKGRTARGERSGTAKLTVATARLIRRDTGKQRDIAKRFGVCKSTVGYIKRGEYWKEATI